MGNTVGIGDKVINTKSGKLYKVCNILSGKLIVCRWDGVKLVGRTRSVTLGKGWKVDR